MRYLAQVLSSGVTATLWAGRGSYGINTLIKMRVITQPGTYIMAEPGVDLLNGHVYTVMHSKQSGHLISIPGLPEQPTVDTRTLHRWPPRDLDV